VNLFKRVTLIHFRAGCVHTHTHTHTHKRHDSSVSIVTRLRAGRPWNHGSILDKVKRFIDLSSPKRPDPLWGAPSLLFNGTGGSLRRVKRMERVADLIL